MIKISGTASVILNIWNIMMIHHLKKLALVGLLVILHTSAYAMKNLSPNENNSSGDLPSGYTSITFQISDDNWVGVLKLPKQPRDNDVVTFKSSAKRSSFIDIRNTDFPRQTLELRQGDLYSFVYDMHRGWRTYGDIKYAQKDISKVILRVGENKVTRFIVGESGFVTDIKLPDTAVERQLVIIESRVASKSNIHASNRVFTTYKNSPIWFLYTQGNWIRFDR